MKQRKLEKSKPERKEKQGKQGEKASIMKGSKK